MSILITGGAGFIGSSLARRLVFEQDQPVIILDNFSDYYDPALKRENIAPLLDKITLVEGDMCDAALLDTVFQQHSITRIVHLAAIAGVRYSIDNPMPYVNLNIGGTVALLDAAKRYNVSLVVQASTSSVYGNASNIPFVEDDCDIHPLAAYPASKRAAELFAYTYHQLFGMNITVLRLFNVYGPNGRPDMMPLRVMSAITQGDTVTLYENGRLERDWTYIDDIVNGIIATLNKPMGYQIINLGYGQPVALSRFVDICERLVGKKALTVFAPAPRSELMITYCDNTRARELLGFHPNIDVEEGLARTWDRYKGKYL